VVGEEGDRYQAEVVEGEEVNKCFAAGVEEEEVREVEAVGEDADVGEGGPVEKAK
jgi:predicted hydrolase (HD superfamily)